MSRTDFAQKSRELENSKVRFPKIIRYRKAEVTIYGKTKSYPFYRLAYRVLGKRCMKSFATYGKAKSAADVADSANERDKRGVSATEKPNEDGACRVVADYHGRNGVKIGTKLFRI